MKTIKRKPLFGFICLWAWVPLALCTFGHPVLANEDTDVLTFYVDDDAPNDPAPNDPTISDPWEDGSPEHPYDNIYEAVQETQRAYARIIVAPGFYQAETTEGPFPQWLFHIPGRGGYYNRILSVTSSDPNDFSMVERTILDYPIKFFKSHGTSTELAGFTIQGKMFNGIDGDHNDQAIIRNCIIRGNRTCDGGVLHSFSGALENCLIADNRSTEECGLYDTIAFFHGTMESCTIVGNSGGIHIGIETRGRGGEPQFPVRIRNSIVYGNEEPTIAVDPALNWDNAWIEIDYCNLQNGLDGIGYCGVEGSRGDHLITNGVLQWGEHNLDLDPRFVRPGAWEVVRIDGSDFLRYLAGDYHLRSRGWRWTDHPVHNAHWLYDTQTSPCIDAGDPASDWGLEPLTVPMDPDGMHGVNRGINLGVYGGTAQASLAPPTEDPAERDVVSPVWPISPVQP